MTGRLQIEEGVPDQAGPHRILRRVDPLVDLRSNPGGAAWRMAGVPPEAAIPQDVFDIGMPRKKGEVQFSSYKREGFAAAAHKRDRGWR